MHQDMPGLLFSQRPVQSLWIVKNITLTYISSSFQGSKVNMAALTKEAYMIHAAVTK